MRVIFMGTPVFALPALQALIAHGHQIVAVITQPDKPVGRTRDLLPSPVKREALASGIPVLQPARLSADPRLAAELAGYAPDLIVVVAYGQILPTEILDLPPHGCLNVHASLLPRYRGAAPIPWGILRGERETGVTIMEMTERMDAGPILFQVREALLPTDTAGSVAERLSVRGAEALLTVLAEMEQGRSLPRVPQVEVQATYAPKLTREQGRIAWTMTADVLSRQIRACTPEPGAYMLWRGREVIVHRVEVGEDRGSAAPGEVVAVEREGGVVVQVQRNSLGIVQFSAF